MLAFVVRRARRVEVVRPGAPQSKRPLRGEPRRLAHAVGAPRVGELDRLVPGLGVGYQRPLLLEVNRMATSALCASAALIIASWAANARASLFVVIGLARNPAVVLPLAEVRAEALEQRGRLEALLAGSALAQIVLARSSHPVVHAARSTEPSGYGQSERGFR